MIIEMIKVKAKDVSSACCWNSEFCQMQNISEWERNEGQVSDDEEFEVPLYWARNNGLLDFLNKKAVSQTNKDNFLSEFHDLCQRYKLHFVNHSDEITDPNKFVIERLPD